MSSALHTAIHHQGDTGNGNGRFRHIGGNDDAPTGTRLQGELLPGRRHPRMQGDDIRLQSLEHGYDLLDFTATGHEHQYITVCVCQPCANRFVHTVGQIMARWHLPVVAGLIVFSHQKTTSLRHQMRGIQIARQAVTIQSRRGDNQATLPVLTQQGQQ